MAVAASMACSGDMPSVTRWTSSQPLVPQELGRSMPVRPMSVPIATVTPRSMAIVSASAWVRARAISLAAAYGGTWSRWPRMSSMMLRVGTRIAPVSIIASHASSSR